MTIRLIQAYAQSVLGRGGMEAGHMAEVFQTVDCWGNAETFCVTPTMVVCHGSRADVFAELKRLRYQWSETRPIRLAS